MYYATEKTYLLTCAPNEDSNKPAHRRSLIRVFVVRIKKRWHPFLSKRRPVVILIRLRKYTGWSESLLGAHVRRYVFLHCGTNAYEAMVLLTVLTSVYCDSPYSPLKFKNVRISIPCPAEPGYALPWQTVQIQISWLLKKPTDLDLHCLSLSI